MENMIQNIFKDKKINDPTKLLSFGFQKSGTDYVFRTELADQDLILTVRITQDGEVYTEMLDRSLHEPYTLHLVDNAVGSFVGSVRAQYEKILTEIADQCFEPDAFHLKQSIELIHYVKDRYGDELEFLWEKFPNNAIWRRKDTCKWYGALLTVSKRRLGITSDENAEIIDLRMCPEQVAAFIDHRLYFPGYHMNKKHWVTIVLDGSVPSEEIFRRIDDSYRLAVK